MLICVFINELSFIGEVSMKKKKATRFAICRKGYDIDAVESYIALESAKFDEAQLAERNRIKDLQSECERLKHRVDELTAREEQIKSALITATENADKLSADVKARYNVELERLRLFRAKWNNAYEQMKERYHFDKDALNMESVAVSVELELKKFLSKDFSLNNGGDENAMEEHFKREVERLTSQQISVQNGVRSLDELNARIKETENKTQQKKDGSVSAAFSLEEANNPTESLEEICRALGLKEAL